VDKRSASALRLSRSLLSKASPPLFVVDAFLTVTAYLSLDVLLDLCSSDSARFASVPQRQQAMLFQLLLTAGTGNLPALLCKYQSNVGAREPIFATMVGNCLPCIVRTRFTLCQLQYWQASKCFKNTDILGFHQEGRSRGLATGDYVRIHTVLTGPERITRPLTGFARPPGSRVEALASRMMMLSTRGEGEKLVMGACFTLLFP
jgi:hypothetical protein